MTDLARPLALLLICLLTAGCSTLKPVEMPPDEVQRQISAGDLIAFGDTVKVATSDGDVTRFRVTGITDALILGDGVEVPIDEVVAVETKAFSVGKTAALAGGTVVLWAVIAAIVLGGTLTL